ncbi:MAG: type IV pilus assembly protein PilM [Candidatus Magasanikbacteria bacterium]|nr:type IV pilus assembly protein PilM [Candidatus Magasanikbacteria bacterium]
MLFNPFTNVIGLDIGDESVKSVRLELHRFHLRKTNIELVSCAEEKIAHGAIDTGDIAQPEEVLRAVKSAVNRAAGKHTTHWVVCALPESKTFIKILTAPIKPENLSVKNVSDFAKNELPIPFNESYIDWQIMPHLSNQSETKFLLGAVLKKTADAYTYLLNIAGLTPLALEVEAMAIVRATLHPNTAGTHLILDIGQTSTTFIMVSAQTIQFTLAFNFSGNLITSRIQQALSCTLDEAERVKITCGMDFENCICHKQGKSEPCKIKPTMDKNMDELAGHVRDGLAFFSEHFHNTEPVESIILSGGSGQMLFFDKELSARVNLRVVRSNPLMHVQLNKTITKDITRSYMRFNTAIGLGLRALQFPLGT